MTAISSAIAYETNLHLKQKKDAAYCVYKLKVPHITILFSNLSAYNWLHKRFNKSDIIQYLPKRYCYLGTEYTGSVYVFI